jgi:hypothetical protein
MEPSEEVTGPLVINEFKFLRELCKGVSPIDRRIRFIGIVNHDGKLLTGLKEEGAAIPMSDARSRGTHESFFVLSSLIEGIKDINSCSADNRTLQISITEFNSTMLIVIPLNCQQIPVHLFRITELKRRVPIHNTRWYRPMIFTM